jgi:hypothetical protein
MSSECLPERCARRRRPNSDLDVLVDLPPEIGLLGLARVQSELEELIGSPVDLVTAGDLKVGIRIEIEQRVVPPVTNRVQQGRGHRDFGPTQP